MSAGASPPNPPPLPAPPRRVAPTRAPTLPLVVANPFVTITLPPIKSINVDFSPPPEVSRAAVQINTMYRWIATSTPGKDDKESNVDLKAATTANNALQLFLESALKQFQTKFTGRVNEWAKTPNEDSLNRLLYTQDRMKDWIAVASITQSDTLVNPWIREYELQTRRILERLGCPLPEDLELPVWLETSDPKVDSPTNTIPAFQQIRAFLVSSFLTNPIRSQHQIESGSRLLGSEWTRYPFLAVYGPQRIGKQLMIRNAVKQMATQLQRRHQSELAKFTRRTVQPPDRNDLIQYTVIDCDILRNGGYHNPEALTKQLGFWLRELSDYAHANDVNFQVRNETSRRIGVVVLEGFDRLFITNEELRRREELESLSKQEDALYGSDLKIKVESAPIRFANEVEFGAPVTGGQGGQSPAIGGQLNESDKLGTSSHRAALQKQLTILLDPAGQTMTKLFNVRIILECQQLWSIPTPLVNLLTMSSSAMVSADASKGQTSSAMSGPRQVLVPMPTHEFRRYVINHFWDQSYMNNWVERIYRILRIASDANVIRNTAAAGAEPIFVHEWPFDAPAAVGPFFVKLQAEHKAMGSRYGDTFNTFYDRVMVQQLAEQKDVAYANSLEYALSYDIAFTFWPYMFIGNSASSVLAEQERIRTLLDALLTSGDEQKVTRTEAQRRFNVLRAFAKRACDSQRNDVIRFTGRSKRGACVLNRTIPPLGLGKPPFDNEEDIASVGFNLDEIGLLLQSIDQFQREYCLQQAVNASNRYLDSQTYSNSCASLMSLIQPKQSDDASAGFEWKAGASLTAKDGDPVRSVEPASSTGPSDGTCSGYAGILDLDVIVCTRSYQWKQDLVAASSKRLLADPRYQLSVRLPERTRLYQLYLNLWWYNNVSARGVQLPSDFCAGIPTLLPPSTLLGSSTSSSSSLPDGTSIGSYANGIVTVGPPVVQPIERVRPSRRSIRREFGGTKTGGHSSSHRAHRSRHSR